MITVRLAQPTRLRTALTVAAAILCAATAGCSSSGGPAPAPAPATATAIDHTTGPGDQSQPSSASQAPASDSSVAAAGSACGLVTPTEVTTASGRPMTMSGDAGSICTFSATADASFVLLIQTYPDVQSMSPIKQLEPGSEHLPSFGDDAFWVNGIVFVQKGSRGLVVQVANVLDAASLRTKLLTLATAALARF